MSNYITKKLQEILDTLHSQEPLPLFGSDAYHADPDAYQTQRNTIKELEREAELVALLSIPPEIEEALRYIRARRRVLWHMEPMPGDPGYTQPTTESEEK